MKKIILLLLTFFIVSCELDSSFENNLEEDRDDVNMIDRFGNQYLDDAIHLYDVKTHAS